MIPYFNRTARGRPQPHPEVNIWIVFLLAGKQTFIVDYKCLQMLFEWEMGVPIAIGREMGEAESESWESGSWESGDGRQ